jgi:hypothetical protein
VLTTKKNAASSPNWLIAVAAIVGLVCGLKVSPLATNALAGGSGLQMSRVSTGSNRRHETEHDGVSSDRIVSPANVWVPPPNPTRPAFGQRTVAVCLVGQVHTLMLHCCHTVVSLLLRCCHTVVKLLSHCCHTLVTRLLKCCYTVGQIRAPEVTHTAFRKLVVDALGADGICTTILFVSLFIMFSFVSTIFFSVSSPFVPLSVTIPTVFIATDAVELTPTNLAYYGEVVVKTHTHTHTHTRTQTHTHTHTHSQTHTHPHRHTYTHTYITAHTRTVGGDIWRTATHTTRDDKAL